MLERLRLENFQCHTKTTVELSPITVIIGQSDVGKSAVLRAIRWAAANKPLGDAFVKHGEKLAVVRLKVDGQTITRAKGSENLYKLGDKEFRAFKDSPPADVLSLLNLCEDNFQSQMDPPFWFTLTAGEVARQLNRIVDLGIIDESLSFIGAKARSAVAAVEVVAERIVAIKEEKQSLSKVSSMVRDFAELETLEKTAAGIVDDRLRLYELHNVAKRREDRATSLRDAVTAGKRVIVLGERAVRQQQEFVTLAKLLGEIVAAAEKVKRRPPSLESPSRHLAVSQAVTKKRDGLFEMVQAIRTVQKVCRKQRPNLSTVVKAKTRFVEIEESRSKLASLVEELVKQRRTVKTHKQTRQAMADALAEESEGICPVCGGPFVGGA